MRKSPFVVVLALLSARGAVASEVAVTPSTFRAALTALRPGDTLRLASGTYPHFTIANLNGSPSAWITITGPTSGDPAIVQADPSLCCNTIEIENSSYVAIQRLTIDGMNLDGVFGLSAKGDTANLVHDIRIEYSSFIHHHGSQQHDAISTKTPTWGWIIRGNTIRDAGTGIYLGNSDGSDPFVGGVIEDNLIVNPIGYCLQIKYQLARPSVPGMPTSPTSTLIRNNVFIKNDDPSPDGDRPNLLVGGFPDTGPGSMDRYEIYGNFFYHNPRESLFQASGRVTIHDNIFVDAPATRAILLQDHDLPLKVALVYNNTIYSAASGIVFGNTASEGDEVIGNVVFAGTPIRGTIANARDNVEGPIASAPTYLTQPSATLGMIDLYPRSGECAGAPLDMTAFTADTDYGVDFNGTSKGAFTYRGAYAGDGANPGWVLAADVKTEIAVAPPPDGGTPDASTRPLADAGHTTSLDGGRSGSDAGRGADAGQSTPRAPGANAGPDAGTDEPSALHGSSCEATHEGARDAAVLLALLAGAILLERAATRRAHDRDPA
jgi:hypothetical protein